MKKIRLIICLLFISIPWIGNGQSLSKPAAVNQEVEKIFTQWGELYFSFEVSDPEILHTLTKVISIDNVDQGVVKAFANRKEFVEFLKFSILYKVLPPPATEFLDDCLEKVDTKQPLAWDFYPSYSAYESMMYQFETDYPELCRISNIGTLSSGRRLLVAKISSHVDSAMYKPRFFYGSSIHGNELTCYVNMLRLIDYLLSNYNADPYITNLVNSIEIYINPLSNPDGTYHNGNNSVNGATRENANYVDLNRNFPDPQNGLHPDGNPWQEETVFFMDFAAQKHFVMSANFHGGAEVVNYPWDTWSQLPADHLWWNYISRQFADTIHTYNSTGYFTDLDNGVTNGYAWYEIDGGRQDYVNYWHHCREATIEVSSVKKPAASNLPNYWNSLHRSILTYMEQCMYGIRGIVTDSVTGEPLHARVYIAGHDIDSSEVYSYLPLGNYHRLLYPGAYTLTFTCPGYYPKVINNISVQNYQATQNDVQLVPIGTGMNESEPVSVQVFPNPVSSAFAVKFHGKEGRYRLELFNILGQHYIDEKIILSDGVNIPLNISNIQDGVSILRLSDGDKLMETIKILKQ